MAIDGFENHRDLIMNRIRHEAKQTRVRMSVTDDQVSEVLVERHQDSAMHVRIGEDGVIARIGRPVTHSFDIVTGSLQVTDDWRPDR